MNEAAINALTELHGNTEDRPVRAMETVQRSLVECQRCGDWNAADGVCGRYSREEWAENLVFLGGHCELWADY